LKHQFIKCYPLGLVILAICQSIDGVVIAEARAGDASTLLQARVEGVTVYDSERLIAFAVAYAAQHEEQPSPNLVAEAIALIYREDGYFLVEVDSEVSGDHVVFRVFEGWIEGIAVEGVDRVAAKAIARYFDPILGVRPLSLGSFERAVMLANDLSGFDISTEIDYPDGQDGARLRILASREEGVIYITADNPPREFAEGFTARLGNESYSLLTPGDRLRVELGYAHFLDSGDSNDVLGSGFYRMPIGANGTYAEGFLSSSYARRGRSGEFQETDVLGFTGGLLIGYPVVRDIHRFQYILAEARYSDANSETPTQDFDSSSSAVGLTYVLGWSDDQGAPTRFNVTLTGGVANDEQALSSEEADQGFWHIRAGLGVSRPLHFIDRRSAIRAEIWGQYTTSRLSTTEEFYLGEREALRGYAFAELAGDYGASGTLEVSHQISNATGFVWNLRPFVFFDAGYADSFEDTSGDDTNTLASAGVGSDVHFDYGFSASGYLGVPLIDGPFTDSGSPAVYLRVTKTW